MQGVTSFIVEIEKEIKDTVKTESGIELFIDNRFNEFENRTTGGTIVSCPAKYSTGAKPGDVLFFHHLVVMDKTQRISCGENKYEVTYSPDTPISSQAIAYKDKDTGEITPLSGWVLLLPDDTVEEEVKSDVIEIVKLKEDPVFTGVVAFHCDPLEDLGIKVGDIVGFAKNRDYRIMIDDVEYYRVRAQDLLYVKEK